MCILVQHLVPLLASEDKEVVTAALQTLFAFVRRSGNAQSRWSGYAPLSSRLTALVQGWGGKAEVRLPKCILQTGVEFLSNKLFNDTYLQGLDLLTCCQIDESPVQKVFL